MADFELIFKDEFQSFEGSSGDILKFTKEVLKSLPPYFSARNQDGSENEIICGTKAAMKYANALLGLAFFRNKFQLSDRDSMRSAILLHDGLMYGVESPNGIVHDHPEMMADFIKGNKWGDIVPDFIREDIAEMVRSHSGQWNKKDGFVTLKTPKTEQEFFVHMCIFLASKGNLFLCGISAPAGLDIKKQIEYARVLVSGKSWNNYVYFRPDKQPYIYLNGIDITIPADMFNGFLALSSERIGSILNMTQMEAKYPSWNHSVFANDNGDFHIECDGKQIPITWEQAHAL